MNEDKKGIVQMILYNLYGGFPSIIESFKTFLTFSIGLVDHYVIYIAIFTIMFIIYLLIRPFMTWFVTLQSVRLLSYLFSSLMVLLFMFLLKQSFHELNDLLINLSQITLHCLALFGLVLAIVHIGHIVMKKLER